MPAGVYCLVERAVRNTEESEQDLSELWEPYTKLDGIEGAGFDHTTVSRIGLYPITRLKGPATLIPDLENENPRAYLRLVPRNLWCLYFKAWLSTPHTREFDEPQESERLKLEREREQQQQEEKDEQEEEQQEEDQQRPPKQRKKKKPRKAETAKGKK